MLKRTITSIVGIAVFVPVVLFSDTLILPIAAAIFTLIALYEMFGCIGVKNNFVLTVPFYLTGAATPFAVRYLNSDLGCTDFAVIALVFLILYLLCVMVFSRGRVGLEEASMTLMMSLYISLAFGCIVYLRDIGNDYVYLLAFIAAWTTDIFAYLVGMAIGRHKLIPDVSPKKTVEGSIGGIVCCTVVFVIISRVIGLVDIPIYFLIIAGIVASCISQVGDLAMSVIKRKYGIKDYGKLFPGHGGVLDRFDSVLAVSVALGAIFSIINIF